MKNNWRISPNNWRKRDFVCANYGVMRQLCADFKTIIGARFCPMFIVVKRTFAPMCQLFSPIYAYKEKRKKEGGYIHDIYALWGLPEKIGIIGANETYQQNTNNKKGNKP